MKSAAAVLHSHKVKVCLSDEQSRGDFYSSLILSCVYISITDADSSLLEQSITSQNQPKVSKVLIRVLPPFLYLKSDLFGDGQRAVI